MNTFHIKRLFIFSLLIGIAHPTSAMEPSPPRMILWRLLNGTSKHSNCEIITHRRSIKVPEPLLDPCDRHDFDILMNAYEYEDYYVFDQDVARLDQSLLNTCYEPLPPEKESQGRTHLERIKYWVDEGASVNACCGWNTSIIMLTASQGYADVCRFLIEHGASCFLQTDYSASENAKQNTALMFAVRWNGNNETIEALLTSLSPSVQQSIRACMPGLIALHYARPHLPRDIRRLISCTVIESFIPGRMSQIERLIDLKDGEGLTAYNHAVALNKPDFTAWLDLNNPEAYKNIRMQLVANIKRVLSV